MHTLKTTINQQKKNIKNKKKNKQTNKNKNKNKTNKQINQKMFHIERILKNHIQKENFE